MSSNSSYTAANEEDMLTAIRTLLTSGKEMGLNPNKPSLSVLTGRFSRIAEQYIAIKNFSDKNVFFNGFHNRVIECVSINGNKQLNTKIHATKHPRFKKKSAHKPK